MNVTKKNIIEMSHEEVWAHCPFTLAVGDFMNLLCFGVGVQVKQKLREYLSASFQYDARMIMDEVVLCVYLRDVAGIDLSAMGDIKWDYQTLLDATKDVFGVKAINTWGYTLRVMWLNWCDVVRESTVFHNALDAVSAVAKELYCCFECFWWNDIHIFMRFHLSCKHVQVSKLHCSFHWVRLGKIAIDCPYEQWHLHWFHGQGEVSKVNVSKSAKVASNAKYW